jgi:hypothetical protein
MKKIGIKKYQAATNSLNAGTTYGTTGGWNYGLSQNNSGMVNPGNANLIKMAPNQNSGMPLVTPSTADPNAKSLTDIKLPASSTIKTPAKGPSFSDKAGAFMGNYGGAITSAAGSLMPLLMKKPKPGDKPYKKGTKLIKYQQGEKDVTSLSIPDSELLKSDLLSGKDNLISKLPKFAQRAFAKKAMARIEKVNQEYNDKLDPEDDPKDVFAENRAAKAVVNQRREAKEYQEFLKNYEAKSAGEEARNKYEKQQAIENAQGEVGPTRKEAADLMRKYNEANKNNPNVIGAIDEEEFNARGRELKNLTSNSSTNAPITYSKDSFAGPSREELETGKTRLDREDARKTYETRLAGESARESYEAKQKGTPITDDLSNKSRTPNKAGLISFKQMTPAQQKQYRTGIASGNKFTVEGVGEYGAATKSQISQSAKMATKGNKPNKPNKPLTKKQETDTYWKDIYESRKGTFGPDYGSKPNPYTGAREASNSVAGKELVRMDRMGKKGDNDFYTSVGLPFPKLRNYKINTSNTENTSVKKSNSSSRNPFSNENIKKYTDKMGTRQQFENKKGSYIKFI